jgi:GntR family transcriptional regulator
VFIQINAHNGVAVYDQIARQVMFAVASGALSPGDLVPSVRELARELAINPNTVVRAYRELQHQEIVETVPGTGLAVRAGARRVCQTGRRALLRERIGHALQESFEAGLSVDEVRTLIDTEIERLRKTHLRSGEPT